MLLVEDILKRFAFGYRHLLFKLRIPIGDGFTPVVKVFPLHLPLLIRKGSGSLVAFQFERIFVDRSRTLQLIQSSSQSSQHSDLSSKQLSVEIRAHSRYPMPIR